MNLLLFVVIFILCYTLFRYKRRRLYKLADRIKSIPEKIPYIGVMQYIKYAVQSMHCCRKQCIPIDKTKKRLVSNSFYEEYYVDIRAHRDNIMRLIRDFSSYSLNNGGVVKMWIGPLLYVGLTNPEDVEFVLKNCLEKADIIKILRSVVGNAGIFAPVSIWTRRRKLLIPAFSPKIINSFMSILISQSDELAEQLSQQNVVGVGKFCIWPFISSYTLDSVCETALGTRFHYLKNPDNPFLKASSEIFSLLSDRVFRVWLWPDWSFNLSSKSKKFYNSLNTVSELTDEIIQKKKAELKDVDIKLADDETIFGQGQKKVRCFLEHLILLSKNESGAGLNDLELREEVLTFLMAGTDTSSIAISNTLTLLGKYPKIQEKVYQEIVDVLGNSDHALQKDDLKKFTYLENVIKESLRLFPPAPLLVRKNVEEIVLPSGYTIPADSGLIVSVWGVGRDKKYWGPNADCFDPDRFSSGEKTGLLISFSSGPRNCIGYNYALMSVKMALIAIVRRYRVVCEEEPGPIPHIDTTYQIMMKASDNYEIALEKR